MKMLNLSLNQMGENDTNYLDKTFVGMFPEEF